MPNYDFFDQNPYGIHKKALNLVGRKKRVLEIGCATGQLSRRLAENECDIIGVEVNKESADIAMRYCKEVLVCDIESMESLEHNDFDFILLLDVLEHLREPVAILVRLKEYLKRGGFIIVSLPNVANWRVRWDLIFGRFDYCECGILDKTHLRFFTEASARKIIEDAGYEIVNFDIVPTMPFLRIRASCAYAIAKYRPNFFARQFLITAKPK